MSELREAAERIRIMYCDRVWQSSLNAGRAVLIVTVPGGKIEPQDAKDILDWLAIIQNQLHRISLAAVEAPEGKEPHE